MAKAEAVNDRTAGVIAPIAIEILRLRLEVAHLRAAIWDDPAFLGNRDEVLQMQIDQLANQLQDLHDRSEPSPTLEHR